MILSEFTGTYSLLRACIGINPWNTKQVADAIVRTALRHFDRSVSVCDLHLEQFPTQYKAVTMDEKEAHERWKDLHRQVITQDAQHWIQSLLGRLERAHIDQQRRNNSFAPRLEIGQSEWRASKSRLLLLDLEETLIVENRAESFERGFEPPEEVVRILQDLTNDAKNRVYVLSGKGARELDKLVAKVPRIGLVAENGCAVMYAGSSPPTGPDGGLPPKKAWTSLVAGTNMSWRGPVKDILSYFTERTPGSWLEDRGASILWRFWSGRVDAKTRACRDFQWARRQAAEAQNLIYDSLGERFSLRIIPGNASFLIMPKNTSRATAVQHIVSLSSVGVQTMASTHPYTAMPTFTVGESNEESDKDETNSIHVHGEAGNAHSDAEYLHGSPSTGVILGHGPHTDVTLFRQPSNAWSPLPSQRPNSPSHQQRAQNNAHLLHPYGLGSFDLVLCVGQDDMLFSYINALDLPFAPITCTSGGIGDGHGSAGIGSEANYYVNGTEDVMKSLQDILAIRGRDQVSGNTVWDRLRVASDMGFLSGSVGVFLPWWMYRHSMLFPSFLPLPLHTPSYTLACLPSSNMSMWAWPV